ncbi:4-(cytidine 5'-diphospho)-2-C-methyl-D-erythritol kinase [Hyphococcus sp.]|uniref:4-(cytidine 5'-diphospho)-2-C-methyl-D-erythritol kinase n=1 Tax=Hyphococcus sp. TaxID=2038636 RepID=UPI003CCB8E62
MIAETAPAKINLYLHVGPLRSDGLHELASLFVFTEDGDRVWASQSDALTLRVTGPFGGQIKTVKNEDNLVWRAAELLRNETGVSHGAAITLEKNLPVAAGVGGGSSDAAAALRALIKLWSIEISDAVLSRLAFSLGADVPACLRRAPVNVSGAGEHLEKGPHLPPLWCCLMNPGVAMPTGPVFRAFDTAHSSPPPPQTMRLHNPDYASLVSALEKTRNDLEPFALEYAPIIHEVISILRRTPGALAARMSGSGATCFALFSSAAASIRAQANARARGWWAMASRLHVR